MSQFQVSAANAVHEGTTVKVAEESGDFQDHQVGDTRTDKIRLRVNTVCGIRQIKLTQSYESEKLSGLTSAFQTSTIPSSIKSFIFSTNILFLEVTIDIFRKQYPEISRP